MSASAKSNAKRSNQRCKPRASVATPDKPGLAARVAAAQVLTRVIDDKRGLDGLLDTRHGPQAYRDLSEQDQGLVRAIVTTALRHRGEIDYAFDRLMDRKPPKKARHLHHTLHVAAAQILFMDVPESAAVDLAVTSLSQEPRSVRFSSLGNAVLRRMAREGGKLFSRMDAGARAKLNMPPWLWSRLKKGYGQERAEKSALMHMIEPVLDITVKENPENWAEKLGGVVLAGNSIRTGRKGSISEWEGYEDGAWWVQDFAAHLPVHLMGNVAGKRVLDLCAAPGGKTAQLIAAGANVTAVEQSHDRLERLALNLKRLGMGADLVQADMMEWQPALPFDCVLLDAPCSSTGTIRRHPDVQWTKSKEDVAALAELQAAMVRRAADFLQPGGQLLFSNCSIDRTEGEDVVAALIKDMPSLKLQPFSADDVFGRAELVNGQGTVRTLPCHLDQVEPPEAGDGEALDPRAYQGMDGFFAARFERI
ncbi:RsmB/NOP family class I SAM-dependent RNA methyltransferase [Pseudahrensia aquimaris]|uniref:RsmB/NOP family class I SAM-dependent RNA methyltransferase n=1 Tax=Pseudahrensia aquimaris TaxID=744461 RepID=A0ABW3FFM3_9HYPH